MSLGALLAAVAVAAAALAARGTSGVARRLDLVAPPVRRLRRWHAVGEEGLRQAGLRIDADRFVGLKVACGIAGATAAATIGLALPTGTGSVALGAYLGYVLPSVLVDRRAAARRAETERETVVLVERLDALVCAGRPAETALALLARRATGAPILDGVLRRTVEAYALGAPLFRTLSTNARAEGLTGCAALADDLERARDLGVGSLTALRERRAALRAAERARALEAASGVEGRLMLVLVLCYLPALVLLVVVPLFIGLIQGLFA